MKPFRPRNKESKDALGVVYEFNCNDFTEINTGEAGHKSYE